jgi:hypothetical protein
MFKICCRRRGRHDDLQNRLFDRTALNHDAVELVARGSFRPLRIRFHSFQLCCFQLGSVMMKALCIPALCCRSIVTGIAEFDIRRSMIRLVVPCGRFATTIHILVSAVVKLTRVEKLPAGLELYRGLGGSMALPETFYKGNENGCRGYTEWGFLSTTSSRATAVEVGCWQGWQRRIEVKAAALRLLTFLLLAHFAFPLRTFCARFSLCWFCVYFSLDCVHRARATAPSCLARACAHTL